MIDFLSPVVGIALMCGGISMLVHGHKWGQRVLQRIVADRLVLWCIGLAELCFGLLVLYRGQTVANAPLLEILAVLCIAEGLLLLWAPQLVRRICGHSVMRSYKTHVVLCGLAVVFGGVLVHQYYY